jgi:hypothetical protein
MSSHLRQNFNFTNKKPAKHWNQKLKPNKTTIPPQTEIKI